MEEDVKPKKKNGDVSFDDTFDVFISYSHKDVLAANKVVSRMKKIKPDWNVFIDQSGLRAGSAWQSMLYTSIGMTNKY